MDTYEKFAAKCLVELDYLDEKKSALEKRARILKLLRPEKKETLDKVISRIRQIKGFERLHVGNSRKAREKFVKDLCDALVPPP